MKRYETLLLFLWMLEETRRRRIRYCWKNLSKSFLRQLLTRQKKLLFSGPVDRQGTPRVVIETRILPDEVKMPLIGQFETL